jgi:hypothetical protein
MKTKYTSRMRFLAALLFLPFTAIAQNQGDATPLGSGGTKILCNSNEALTATVSSDGKLNFVACTQEGAVLTAIAGDGETLSVIPISNATNLNGVGALSINGVNVASDSIETGSTTTVLNLTAHAAREDDYIVTYSGTAGNIRVYSPVCSTTVNTVTLCNALPATPANGDLIRVMRPLIGSMGENAGIYFPFVNIDSTKQDSAATGLLKLVDAVWGGSADAGVQALGVMNQDESSLVITEGDYMPFAIASNGVIKVSVTSSGQKDGASGLIKNEDATASSGDAGVAALAQRLDQLATGQTTSNSEYAVPLVDTLSRLYVNPWGAAVTEFSSSCGTATASTADVAIKAAVASNRIYVGAITCASSDADNATNINFKDGTTVVAVGGVNQMATTSAGTFTATFNPPLRGTSNTAFNFNTAVSTSSVICCASTFTSPY